MQKRFWPNLLTKKTRIIILLGIKIESIPKLVKGRILNSNGKGVGAGLEKDKAIPPLLRKKEPSGRRCNFQNITRIKCVSRDTKTFKNDKIKRSKTILRYRDILFNQPETK